MLFYRKKKKHQKCNLISVMCASPTPCIQKEAGVRNMDQLHQRKKPVHHQKTYSC